MKTRTVKRHYCDHCHKGMFQRPSMERHEVACFKNPNRKCPVCFDAPEHKPDWDSKGETVDAKGAECPACLMAMVMRENRHVHASDEDGHSGWINYPNFKEELRAFRNEMNKTSDQIKQDLGIWTV